MDRRKPSPVSAGRSEHHDASAGRPGQDAYHFLVGHVGRSGSRERIGNRPYLFVTVLAARGLGLSGVGLGHGEDYPDAGRIEGRIIELEAIPSAGPA